MSQTPDYLIFDREKSIRYSRVRISNVWGKSSSSNLAKLSSSGGIFAGAGFLLVERQIPDIYQNRSVFEASMKLCTGVDPPKGSWKKIPPTYSPPGGRHLEIQYSRHFRPIFSYNSKPKAGRNILFVANPPF